jgi:hypothetical protein
MHPEKPLLPEPLGAELDLWSGDAPRSQGATVWEDVSGGLHWRSPFNKGRRAEDRLSPEALEAFSFGHSLLADGELPAIDPPLAAHVLIDDAGGRFAIDPETGVISLADPGLARSEFGRVHRVRVRSLDLVGGAYEATFHLRVASPLPEAVMPDGADPFAPSSDPHFFALAPPPAAPMRAWREIAAAAGVVNKRSAAREDAPFGAALGEDYAAYPSLRPAPAPLSLETPLPAPAPHSALWLDA